ncbi:hypothetical protein SLS58_006433 [Diplodia intermedia]|uniref:Uncharacterized protein n=1 Tax=Diplodia intermedia TaxID=856260 RepID=A0ABR3TN25_9PEZI
MPIRPKLLTLYALSAPYFAGTKKDVRAFNKTGQKIITHSKEEYVKAMPRQAGNEDDDFSDSYNYQTSEEPEEQRVAGPSNSGQKTPPPKAPAPVPSTPAPPHVQPAPLMARAPRAEKPPTQ